jgi:hypothetical protein
LEFEGGDFGETRVLAVAGGKTKLVHVPRSCPDLVGELCTRLALSFQCSPTHVRNVRPLLSPESPSAAPSPRDYFLGLDAPRSTTVTALDIALWPGSGTPLPRISLDICDPATTTTTTATAATCSPDAERGSERNWPVRRLSAAAYERRFFADPRCGCLVLAGKMSPEEENRRLLELVALVEGPQEHEARGVRGEVVVAGASASSVESASSASSAASASSASSASSTTSTPSATSTPSTTSTQSTTSTTSTPSTTPALRGPPSERVARELIGACAGPAAEEGSVLEAEVVRRTWREVLGTLGERGGEGGAEGGGGGGGELVRVPGAWEGFLRAMRRRGYAYVRLDAEDVQRLDALRKEAERFFALPAEEKERCCGVEGLGLRNVGYMHRPDLDKELFTVRGLRPCVEGDAESHYARAVQRLWPPGELRDAGTRALERLSELTATVSAVMLLSAGHPWPQVRRMLERPVPYANVHATSLSNLTCFHYAPSSPDSYPCLPHTDVGLVTLIPLSSGGLSLWDMHEERWVDVEGGGGGAGERGRGTSGTRQATGEQETEGSHSATDSTTTSTADSTADADSATNATPPSASDSARLAVVFPGECMGFATSFVPTPHQVAWLAAPRFSTPLQYLPDREAPLRRCPRAGEPGRSEGGVLLLAPAAATTDDDAVLGTDLVAAISAARTPQTFFKGGSGVERRSE